MLLMVLTLMYFLCIRKHALTVFLLACFMIFQLNNYLLSLSQEGEIWPNLTAHFTIVFKPEEAKLYQQTIYCDVAGQWLT